MFVYLKPNHQTTEDKAEVTQAAAKVNKGCSLQPAGACWDFNRTTQEAMGGGGPGDPDPSEGQRQETDLLLICGELQEEQHKL